MRINVNAHSWGAPLVKQRKTGRKLTKQLPVLLMRCRNAVAAVRLTLISFPNGARLQK